MEKVARSQIINIWKSHASYFNDWSIQQLKELK